MSRADFTALPQSSRELSATAPNPQLLESIFHQVLERPVADRLTFLESACAGDAQLRARVLRLLTCFDQKAAILDRPPPGIFDGDFGPEPLPGRRIGPYEIVRNLASGGMGTVWLARRADEQFEKQVALKLIKRGMDTDELLARFRTERQVLASLDHPNIARLLDGGVTDDGLPYLVMEYVDGLPIDRFCDENRLTVAQRLELFRTMSAAVQFAHQNLVVHRDLKPSNILVSSDGVPKLLDFGIAKLLNPDSSSSSSLTAPELRIMTPRYASPEQIRGEKISTASDVYALGVVLYELLTGLEPYELATRSRAEYERAICEQEPARPSTAVARLVTVNEPPSQPRTLTPQAVCTARRDEPRRLQRRLSGDLDMIVLRALRKEPERRYSTVEQFSEDVRRHLAHLPILARPDSWTYRARKLVARNPGLMSALGMAAAALVAATGISISFARSEARQHAVAAEKQHIAETAEQRVIDERDATRAERDKAVAMANFLIEALRKQDPFVSGHQDILVSEAMRQAVQMLDRGEIGNQPDLVAALLDAVSQVLDHAGKSAEAERLASRALELRRRSHPGDHPDVAASLSTLGVTLRSLGRFDEAVVTHQTALDMARRLFPEDHACVAQELSNVAACHQSLGRAQEALSHLDTALAMRQRLYGVDHPDVAQNLNNVASCLESLGRQAEALPKYEAALEVYQRVFNGDHARIATVLNNAANCLNSLGRSAEALTQHEAALEMYRRLFQSDHPNVAISLDNLGLCLQSLGRSEEALSKHEAALTMRQRLYVGDHPQLASSLNNIAVCLDAIGRPNDALPKYQAALAMRQRLFVGDHPDVALTLSNAGVCLHSLGRSEDARSKLQESLEMYQRLYDGNHPHVAKGLNWVGRCLRERGRPTEAMEKYEAALDMYRHLLKGDHPHIAMCLNSVGLCLMDLGRPAEALPRIEEGLEMYRRVFQRDHVDIARSLNNLAGCLHALGRFSEALPQYEAVLDMRGRLFRGDSGDVASGLNGVGLCLNSMGRTGEALENYQAALEMNQRLFTGDHAEVANGLCNVAVCLQSLGRSGAALAKIEAGLEMRKRILPAGHVEIEVARSFAGVILVDLERYDEAEPILLESIAALERAPNVRPARRKRGIAALAKLYDAKHTAEPHQGFDEKAARWHEKLRALDVPRPGTRQFGPGAPFESYGQDVPNLDRIELRSARSTS